MAKPINLSSTYYVTWDKQHDSNKRGVMWKMILPWIHVTQKREKYLKGITTLEWTPYGQLKNAVKTGGQDLTLLLKVFYRAYIK